MGVVTFNPREKERLTHIAQVAEWSPEPIWTLCKIEKSLLLSGVSTVYGISAYELENIRRKIKGKGRGGMDWIYLI